MENKPCWNSKSMGMHLAHNIRILKIKSKKNFFASWLSSVKFTFFSMSFGFCTSNGSVRILKKAWEFFSKWYNFHNLLQVISFQKNISSSFFQYSDRTVACTETNDTSAESLGSQLFGAWGTRAWHGQEGATPPCRKRHWKKK